MKSQYILTLFAGSIVILSVFSALLLGIFLFKNTPTLKAVDWYDKKFKQLITAFTLGLTIFSLIVSFLALIPRYDYEAVREDLEKLKQKSEELDKKYDLFQDDMNQTRKKIADREKILQQKYDSLNMKYAALVMDLQRTKTAFELLSKNVFNNYTKEMVPAVEKRLKVKLPEVELPEVKLPEVKLPEVDVPKVDVPKVGVNFPANIKKETKV